jgi:serine/threonine-protein kinase RsbW
VPESHANVTLELESWPQSVTLVRSVIAGVAEELGFESELQDDLKTAVSEACNNVVMHAYAGLPGLMTVHIDVVEGGVEVTVRDEGGGIKQVSPAEDRMGVGLAVISALSQRAEFLSVPDGGTEVSMGFDGSWNQAELPRPLEVLALPEQLPRRPEGSIHGTLAPGRLIAPVLGRLTRVLAAGSHFSLDRFSDLYLVMDNLSAHAAEHAASQQIEFGVESSNRRLQVEVAPFREGSGALLREPPKEAPSVEETTLSVLVDELEAKTSAGLDTLRLVLLDQRRGEETSRAGE